MNSRELVKNVLQRKNSAGRAYWTGHPSEAILPIMAEEWGIEPTREAVSQYLEDDVRWYPADEGFRSKDGTSLNPAYGITKKKELSSGGCFENVETVAEVENYPWPDVSMSDFSQIYAQIDRHPDKAVFTGMWSPFFHVLADFFGMETLFIQMYENPAVVECAVEHIVDYYVQMNDMFFKGLGDRADVMFFGNDFGTQRDLILSPQMFRKFILPGFKRIIQVGKKYGKICLLHSCGSIYRIIPDLIDAGVDAIHPLQAQAAGMSAAELAQYKNDLAFVGGIDAQSFFVNATVEQIREEVHRVRDTLGPNIVISPSHEEILPNVPPRNVLAMSRAAREA